MSHAAAVWFAKPLAALAALGCLVPSSRPRPLLALRLDAAEFDNMFRDSGYWDYFLLATYDVTFRVYGVYTLLVATDFSAVERAAWALTGFALRPAYTFFFLDLRSLGELFYYVATWLFCLIGAFFFFAALLPLLL